MIFSEVNPTQGVEVLVANRRLIFDEGVWKTEGVTIADSVIAFIAKMDCKVLPKKGSTISGYTASLVLEPGDRVWVLCTVNAVNSSDNTICVRTDEDDLDIWLQDFQRIMIESYELETS